MIAFGDLGLFHIIYSTHISVNFHVQIVLFCLHKCELIRKVTKLICCITTMSLELLRGHLDVLVVQTIRLLLFSCDHLNVSIKSREK